MSSGSGNTSTPQSQAPQHQLTVDSISGIDGNTVRTVEGQTAPKNGSAVHAAYKHRNVAYYPVTSDELDQITMLNVLSTLGFSAGAFFSGLALDLLKDMVMSPNVPEAIMTKLQESQITYVVTSGVFFGLAIILSIIKYRQKGAIVSKAYDPE